MYPTFTAEPILVLPARTPFILKAGACIISSSAYGRKDTPWSLGLSSSISVVPIVVYLLYVVPPSLRSAVSVLTGAPLVRAFSVYDVSLQKVMMRKQITLYRRSQSVTFSLLTEGHFGRVDYMAGQVPLQRR